MYVLFTLGGSNMKLLSELLVSDVRCKGTKVPPKCSGGAKTEVQIPEVVFKYSTRVL